MKDVSAEELQPSLLDRLSERGEFLERVTVVYRGATLTEAGLTPRHLRGVLEREGLRLVGTEEGSETFETTPSSRRVRDIVSGATATGNGAKSRPIGDFLDIRELVKIPFVGSERSLDVSIRELRASVVRNVGWLLNTVQLMADDELEAYPAVQSSVLNYGVPALPGTTPGSIDVAQVADGIRAAIQRFEPRLSEIDVKVVDGGERSAVGEITFAIHARCWGPQTAERLDLRTSLVLETGRFDVRRDGR